MKHLPGTVLIIFVFIVVVISLPFLVHRYVNSTVQKADARLLKKNNIAKYIPAYLPNGLSWDKKSREYFASDFYNVELTTAPGVSGGQLFVTVQKPKPNEQLKVTYPDQTLTYLTINSYQAKMLTSSYGPTNNSVTIRWVENGKEIIVLYNSGKTPEASKEETVKIAQSLKEEVD